MPRTQVYVGNDSVIPVDAATLVTGFRCPWTKEVFADRKEYLKHLRDYRTSTHYANIFLRNREKRVKVLNDLGSFPNIAQWILDNPMFFYDNAQFQSWNSRKHKDFPREKFHFKLRQLSLTYDSEISCSHHAPRDRETNWGGNAKDANGTVLPRHFPGWRGKITFEHEGIQCFPSNIFHGTGINFGSGSGHVNKDGSSIYGGEIYIFAADWPGLEKRLTVNLLKDERVDGFIFENRM